MSLPRYERYKDSGVEWLGEVPEHWGIWKNRWLCEIQKRIVGELGYDVISVTQQGLKIKDIESNDGQLSMDYSKYQLVEIGDFAMNHMDLLTGYVDLSNMTGVTSPDYRVFRIRDLKFCYDRYILYLFQMGYKNKIFYAYGQGSSQLGRWRLPTEQFNGLMFPLPFYAEQQEIAAFLDSETAKIDALIAEQQKLIELLKEKRQAVISHAVTKGLNPDVKMKDSGIEWLGEVPEHWTVVSIKRIATIRYGIGEPPKYQPDGIPLIRATNIHAGYIYEENMVFVNPEDIPEKRIVWLKSGDIIVVRSGAYTGDSAIIPEGFGESIAGFDMVLCCREEIAPQFMQYTLLSKYLKDEQIDLEKTRAAQPHLNAEELGACIVLLPMINEQEGIVDFLDSETRKIDILNSEARKVINYLQERRTALISAAVTGKIDVRGLVEPPQREATP